MSDTHQFFNRELSWLEFNNRVLGEAQDAAQPLLERLKFLAITGSNLDEFFKVRVGGLQLLHRRGVARHDPSGLTPGEQLRRIHEKTHAMVREQSECYLNEVEPGLTAAGLRRVKADQLTEKQQNFLRMLFRNEIFSVLTPMRIGEDVNFPLLVHESLSVCVRMQPTEQIDGAEVPRIAVIPFNAYPLRFITLPSDGGGYDYILLEDAVCLFADRFFKGETILESVPFRITRNADLALQEEQASDLMSGMEDLLEARKEADCVRLEIAENASEELVEFLRKLLNLDPSGVYPTSAPLDMSAFWELVEISGFDELKIDEWLPQASPEIPPTADLFEILSERDVLLYHPYQSFEPVIRFLEQAAADPDVLAIKQTLYRTSSKSPIVSALMKAAENGKHVAVVVELKARFDEARNIAWAKDLERAGVQVIYGIKGLKTHAKVCVVVRREPQGIRRYCHFGTGNYNEMTARIYSDASLFTSDDELGSDAVNFMYAITGYSQPNRFHKLDAAPMTIRSKLLELIEGEIERKKQNQPAEIMVKVNSLVDPPLIEALYRASQAGVRIRLNVRGACCLIPGVAGLSENIDVVSIIDRFLEHARILYFHHGGDPQLFISSADWMPRNLDRRLELMVPVESPENSERLIDILKTYFRDNQKSHRLKKDGSYRRIRSKTKKQIRSQEILFREAIDDSIRISQDSRTVFVPHLAEGESHF